MSENAFGQSAGFWDSFSSAYSDDAQGDIPDKVVDILFDSGALDPQDAVLEVGSGPGTYSVRLAPRLRVLTCMDVSSSMLDILFSRLSGMDGVRVERFLMDWNEYTPRKGYHACFAALLPNASSEESLLRMEGAAKKRCSLVTWEINQREALTLRIRDELGLDWPKGIHDPCAVGRWLKDNDRSFRTYRVRTSIDRTVPLDFVISKEVSRFSSAGYDDDIAEMIKGFVADDIDGDMVRYRADNSVILYTWDVP